MANVTTEFAYPCTRGTQKIGKILSERMISTLIKLVEPERACHITSNSNISDPYEAYLLDGYFFSNPTGIGIGWDVIWFYTSSNQQSHPESADFFPELYVDDNGNCLFGGITEEAPDGADGDEIQINGEWYLLHLFNIVDIKSFDQVRCPYYIA